MTEADRTARLWAAAAGLHAAMAQAEAIDATLEPARVGGASLPPGQYRALSAQLEALNAQIAGHVQTIRDLAAEAAPPGAPPQT